MPSPPSSEPHADTRTDACLPPGSRARPVAPDRPRRWAAGPPWSTWSPWSASRDGLLIALLGLPWLLLVRHFWFVADDAFISFRYSRNWASGLGLVFNPGDAPAEGYSNFLVVALGAALERVGLDVRLWVPVASALSGALLVALVYRVARARLAVGRPAAFLATASLAWSAPFVVWSSSGLEAMPYTLLFAAAFERLCLRADGAAPVQAALLAVALALTRVEGIAWALGVLPLLGAWTARSLGRPVLRPLARYALVVGVLYGAWFAWRASYFGHAWPMTVYAKVGFSLERVLRGVDYVVVQVLTCLSLLVLLPGVAVALRAARRPIGVPLAALPAGVVAYTVLVGGDWMAFGRFLLPALPFVAWLWAWVLSDLGPAVASVAGPAVIALAVAPGFDVHPVPRAARARFHFRLNTPHYRSEHAQWEFQRFNGIRWSVKGRALGALFPPGTTVVMGAIGAASYESDLVTLDRHGFVTPEVALRNAEPAAELRSPGHDTVVDETWFVARGHAPDVLRAKIREAAGRADLVETLATSALRLRRTGTADRYVPDFVRLGPERASSWYLTLWRRIARGTSADSAWADFEARLTAFEDTGRAREVAVEPPGDRVPGAPAWL